MVVGSVAGAACGSVQPLCAPCKGFHGDFLGLATFVGAHHSLHSFTLIFGSLVDTLGSGKTMSEALLPVIFWCATRSRFGRQS